MRGDAKQDELKSFRNTSGKWKFFAIYGIFVAFFAFALVSLTLRGQLERGLFIVFWCIICWYLTVGVIAFIDTSELLINEEQIARRILGIICQRVKWADVTSIKQSFVRIPRGIVVGVQISHRYSSWRFRLRGPIKISQMFERFEELIDILNERISTQQIPVEIIRNGLRERRPQLLPPPGDTVQ